MCVHTQHFDLFASVLTRVYIRESIYNAVQNGIDGVYRELHTSQSAMNIILSFPATYRCCDFGLHAVCVLPYNHTTGSTHGHSQHETPT